MKPNGKVSANAKAVHAIDTDRAHLPPVTLCYSGRMKMYLWVKTTQPVTCKECLTLLRGG